jgi:hypothetical protein
MRSLKLIAEIRQLIAETRAAMLLVRAGLDALDAAVSAAAPKRARKPMEL